MLKVDLDNIQIGENLVFWRDFLLEEHKNYYATVIANVGKNYDAANNNCGILRALCDEISKRYFTK